MPTTTTSSPFLTGELDAVASVIPCSGADKMNRSEHDLYFGIALKEHNELIGVTGLHQLELNNRSCVFGIGS